jgi:hypothetical protein
MYAKVEAEMSRSRASGYTLGGSDVPTILGMVARGDRDHDIAAWFGVNQGRIAEAKEGKYGPGQPAAAHSLPPKGAPGVKGRLPRAAVDRALTALSKGDSSTAETILNDAKINYDQNEA